MAKLATAIRPKPTIRNGREIRSMRWGLSATTTINITTSMAGNKYRDPRFSRSGNATCKAIATTDANATGNRFSPAVGRLHAGMITAPSRPVERPCGSR